MVTYSYPVQNILLPPHKASINILKMFSFIGALLILFAGTSILLEVMFGTKVLVNIFDATLLNLSTAAALILSSASLFIYKKNATLKKIQTIIVIVFGSLICAIGFLILLAHFFSYTGIEYFSAANLKAGLLFFLIGCSFIINCSPIVRRFYYTQLIIAVAFSISLAGLIESIYQFAPSNALFIDIQRGFLSSLLLVVLCQSVLFLKPERGFISLFTTQTNSSQLAYRSLIYFITIPPIVGLFFFLLKKMGFINETELIAMLVTSVIFLSIIISWVNVKFLYPTEIEHYLLKEALRINNIKLELNVTDLSTKVNQLEQEQEEVIKKLNHEQVLSDYIESTD